MKIQDLDFFSPKEYTFSLNKANRFFTLVTILLTFLIITLSVLINYQTVAHLWIDRSELPMRLSRSMSLPNPFTDCLICIASNDSSLDGTMPQVIFVGSLNQTLIFPYVNKEWIQRNKPSLIDEIDSGFSCINIAGHQFTYLNNFIEIGIDALTATILIEVISEEELQQNKGSKFKRFDLDINQQADYIIPAVLVRTVSGEIKDSIKINSKAQKFSLFYKEDNINTIAEPQLYDVNYTRFSILFFSQKKRFGDLNGWSNVIVIITRLDLGFIVGAVLSWMSILTIAFGFIVCLFMDRYTNLLQIKELFYLQPKIREPSLFKFVIASFKQGIFKKEDKYVKLSQRLQSLKDISIILKTKHSLNKIFPYRVSKLKKHEIVDYDANFNQHKEEYITIVQDYSQRCSASQYFGKVDDQKPESFLVSIKRKFLQQLDFGSDQISVKYKSIHKSKCNVIIALIIFITFVAFLSIFGAFQNSKSIEVYNSRALNFQHEIQYNQIILATSSPQQFLVQLINGNNNELSNINLSNSSSCMQNLSEDQIKDIERFGPYIYCFQQNIKISQSQDQSKVVSLYINTDGFRASIFVFHYPSHAPTFYYNPLFHMIPIRPIIRFGNLNYQSSIKLTNFIENNKKTSISSEITLVESVQAKGRRLTGTIIILNPVQTTISETTNTFFDIIQNIWGFGTIFFAFGLSKIMKYISINHKSRNSKEKGKQMGDIRILLSKINVIQTGRHKSQLQKAKYYIKSHQMKKY